MSNQTKQPSNLGNNNIKPENKHNFTITSVARPESTKRLLKDELKQFLNTYHNVFHIPGAIYQSEGHDVTMYINSLQGNPQQLLLAIADGHGATGHYHSNIAIRLLAKQFIKCIPLFLRHLNNYTDRYF